MEEPLIEMVNIVKTFPGIVANDHTNFTLHRGEIHALLGENGAGKTTLMNILYGIYKMDSGVIKVKGKIVNINSPKDAIRFGIGMVHQNFKLIPAHTVVENVILGSEKNRVILDLKKAAREVQALSVSYGLPINPKTEVWKLSMGERQRVEILKLLYRRVEVMILDEPTSVLTPQEKKELFSSLKEMAEAGNGIIFITHKLDEVFEISNKVTVLRKGKTVASKLTKETSKSELANLMIGRPVLFELEKKDVSKGRAVLEVVELSTAEGSGEMTLKNISFEVREGEIVGVAGIAGNGQKELVEALTGLRHVDYGKVIVLGKNLTNHSPKTFFEHGVAFIPEERFGVGAVPGLSVAENLILKAYRYSPFSNKVFIKHKEVEAFSKSLVEQFEIATTSINSPVKFLSGGNIQKVVLARELSSIKGKGAKVIIAMYPTRGLDVGATEYVRRLFLKMREAGSGVLLISEELDELLSVCDRIFVMHEGRIVGEAEAGKADVERIGLMMAGIKVS